MNKLQYLSELRHVYGVMSPDDKFIRADVAIRMQKVCDSIEKDMGLKSSSVGDLTVKIDVDTTALKEATEEVQKLIDKCKEVRPPSPRLSGVVVSPVQLDADGGYRTFIGGFDSVDQTKVKWFRQVWDGKWYLPWTWGDYRLEEKGEE